jgi:pristinamycin I synthase 3 and 4
MTPVTRDPARAGDDPLDSVESGQRHTMTDYRQRLSQLSPAKQALLEKMLMSKQTAGRSAVGIPSRSRRDPLPLSFSQRRLWFLTSLGEGGPAYNIVSALRIQGPLDVAALGRTVNAILTRHETLRTRFPALEGQPYQDILEPKPLPLDPVDLSGVEDRERHLRQQIMADAWTGFDLERGPLLRLTLYRLGPGDHALVLVMHHIISDGWTTGVFIREMITLYTAYHEGRQPDLAPLPIQYADFTEWQHQQLNDRRVAELLRYWESQVYGMPRVLGLPTDLPRPAVQTFRGRWLNFQLDRELSRDLEQLGSRVQATPFMTLLAAFGLLLGRLSGRDDLGIGVPVANRTHAEFEPLIGFFVNTLVMRLKPSGRSSFLEYLEQVRLTALDAFQHQDLPFERLVEELRPERDLGRNPVIQVVFAYQQTEAMAQDVTLPGLITRAIPLDKLPVRFDIELHMWQSDGRFQGAFIYGTDLFHAETMDQWLIHFQALLRQAVRRPDVPLARLDLLSDDQRIDRLHRWNRPASPIPEATIHRLFEEQALAFPDRIALSAGHESVTYGMLDRRANQIAHGLRASGVDPESIVALYMPRSVALIAGLLGILKAGAAYLPLDPANPVERNRAMVADSRARLLLIDGSAPEADYGVPVRDVAEFAGEPEGAIRLPLDPGNAAYVNFTSGSTGRPKGIVIPHRAVVRLVCNTDYVQIRAGDALAHASNVSFDAATFEIWGALLNGARLVVVPRETVLSPEDYADLLRVQRIDHVFMTTALFNRMVDDAPEGLAGLGNVLFGGEISDPRRVAKLLAGTPPRRLLHVYGPTEGTTFSTAGLIREVARPDGLLAVGRPIANSYARVLDETLSHAAVGAEGQLYLGGLGLARGYLGRPAETADAFIPDPYALEPGSRLYASGDRARYRADGDLDILGRVDRQVKIRGFRIEPGEIETCLMEHPGVREAAVLVRVDPRGDRGLAAFVSADPDYRGAVSSVTDASERVAGWEDIFDQHVYNNPGAVDDPLFNTIGWVNSFDGRSIPASHMELWADDIVGQVLEHKPRRVLELGFGTGMLLFRIAPHCEAYRGIDFSRGSLGYVQAIIAERPGLYDHVRLSRRRAHELDDVEDGGYDAVILNSVAQYFPDLQYLRDVIERGLTKLRPGGIFFLGDLRSHALLKVFHTELAISQATPEGRCDVLRRAIARKQDTEKELCLDPAFFTALARRRGDVAHVRIRLQRTPHHDELSKYRFHVVLTRGAEPDASRGLVPELEDGRKLTLDQLEGRLRDGSAEGRAFRLINARVHRDVLAARLLDTVRGPASVAELQARVAAEAGDGIDPNDVQSIAESMGYRVEISWAPHDPECFDAAFYRHADPTAPILMPITRMREASDWDAYANNPLRVGGTDDLGVELRQYLKHRLPDYMVPVQIVTLDRLPLGPTGKLDRAALLDLQTAFAEPIQAKELGRDTPLEEVLTGLFADLLGVPSVGADSNFFELGGHSLLATSLAARISKAVGCEIPLKLIFEKPTVAAVARWLQVQLEAKAGLTVPPIVPAGRDRPLPASFAQRRLWFLEQMRITRTAYNMPLLLQLRGLVDVAVLHRALHAIVERHESLRTAFYEVNGEPYQRILPCERVPFELIDLSELPPTQRVARRDTLVDQLLDSSFDLSKDILLRVTLFKMDHGEYFLAGAFHHIASDGWSVEVFAREISSLYRAFLGGGGNPLEPLPIQYADFAVWQREWLQGEVLQKQIAAWKRLLRNLTPLRLPTDHDRPEVETFRGGGHNFAIPAETAVPLRALTHKHGATLFMTLLAGFKALMHRYTGQENIVLGAPIANRNRGETEGLLGFFVNSLVLCTDLSGDPSFVELLGRVRRTALDAYTHQDLPFEKLVEELHPERHLNRNPLFQVAFALQQTKAMRPMFKLPGVEMTIVTLPRIDVRFDMEIHLWEDGESIQGYIVYNADLFEAATIARLAGHYERALANIAARPEVRLSELQYLSPEELRQLEMWD